MVTVKRLGKKSVLSTTMKRCTCARILRIVPHMIATWQQYVPSLTRPPSRWPGCGASR